MSSLILNYPEIAGQVLQDLQNLNVTACVGGSTALIIHGIQRPQTHDVDILIYSSSGNGNTTKNELLSKFSTRYTSNNARNLFFHQDNDTTNPAINVQLLCAGPFASLGWLRLNIPRSSISIQGIQTLKLSFCLLSKLVAANTRLQDRRPGAERYEKGQRDKSDILKISTRMWEQGARFEGTLSRAANSCWRYFDREELLVLEGVGVRFNRE